MAGDALDAISVNQRRMTSLKVCRQHAVHSLESSVHGVLMSFWLAKRVLGERIELKSVLITNYAKEYKLVFTNESCYK